MNLAENFQTTQANNIYRKSSNLIKENNIRKKGIFFSKNFFLLK